MQEFKIEPALLSQADGQTVIVTGAANGIGAATATLFNHHGANVILSDLASLEGTAAALIQTFSWPEKAAFVAADVLDWEQMKTLFHETVRIFGEVNIVIANAGVMESHPVLDLDNVDENGDLRESTEGFRVIDINLKGTLNTLRLAMHHMRNKHHLSRSIVLLASTSGYFGGTGVAAYVASKHGSVGLLRASQTTAQQYGIRINAVAPFFTPTRITAGFSEQWLEAGLEANTPQRVADMIGQVAMDSSRKGSCVLVAGNYLREMESTRTRMLAPWLGEDVANFMTTAMQFFQEIGGYVLPKYH
ncbi:dehydrogenase with different specificitie [Aspergillus brunneoviolaceus CBS 621.78]|uniref:Dehydrogenase with different specificitie n=1 Tax=Aspergillus brunneoviolaceus CBS 621.78 TaxID=1450534 RepID=A0ACD1FSL2_9EURO|nr:dehydrogenase with different specificitie [Aspergillus brunneoviolaceus CBS 621.78]RAH39967.1 dehydrogenase with different specificitie [Aspergillus brunneoviolaceus CBS 621.78]